LKLIHQQMCNWFVTHISSFYVIRMKGNQYHIINQLY
jgi:hypothetical protein